MIHIGKPYITENNNRAFLKAEVSISEDTALAYKEVIIPKRAFCVWLTDEDYPPLAWAEDGTLWFEVPGKYARYLCKERSNAFVVALFWYAMATGSDIEFEAPLSKRLYDGMTNYLMPELEKTGFAPIHFSGPVTLEPVWCEKGVVTGLSGGVDSSYTLQSYSRDDVPADKKLTHLVHHSCSYLFKPCDIHKGLETLYWEENQIEEFLQERLMKIAREKGFDLIITKTNLDRDFYRGGYIYMAMYRYLACTLALEHLFGTYISSSSGHDTGVIEVSLFVPTQHYEDLLCSSLCTETFRYITSDYMSRVEKLRELADDKVFQKTAKVCFDTGKNGENCGVCYGCLKTMIPLDLLGKLDAFSDSFDLDAYYREREERIRFLIEFSKRPEASSARETVRQLKELAEKEPSEAGELFLNLYKTGCE